MNNVEELVAKLIDEHKITGEEALILIKAITFPPIKIGDISPSTPNIFIQPHDSLVGVSDSNMTITY